MTNPIIAELRRIRDAHAKRYNYDVEAMAEDLMKLEPWMAKRTYVLRNGKIVPLVPQKKQGRTHSARRQKR